MEIKESLIILHPQRKGCKATLDNGTASHLSVKKSGLKQNEWINKQTNKYWSLVSKIVSHVRNDESSLDLGHPMAQYPSLASAPMFNSRAFSSWGFPLSVLQSSPFPSSPAKHPSGAGDGSAGEGPECLQGGVPAGHKEGRRHTSTSSGERAHFAMTSTWVKLWTGFGFALFFIAQGTIS